MLILGGTGFIGPHFVRALTAGGHKITLFNRGKRDPEVKAGIEQLLGDRNGQVERSRAATGTWSSTTPATHRAR